MSADKYSLLKDLLPWLEQYEQEQGTGSGNLPDFQKWLGERLKQASEALPPTSPEEALEGEIARYFSILNRYAKFYIKKALHQTSFVSLDDFGYLMHLLDGGSTTKSALILKNMHDIPSGTEIIKRLIRQGWVTETRDEIDKRRIFLTINEAGKATLFSSLGQFRKVSRILSRNLDITEKQQLLRILKKLDAYHHQRFSLHKNKSIDDIID